MSVYRTPALSDNSVADALRVTVERHSRELTDLIQQHLEELARVQFRQEREVRAIRANVSMVLARGAGDNLYRAEADRVLLAVAEVAGVSPAVYIGPGRQPQLVLLRKVAMWLLRKHTTLSYPQIGRLFDRDHTTVMHAVQTVDAKRATNKTMDHLITEAEARMAQELVAA